MNIKTIESLIEVEKQLSELYEKKKSLTEDFVKENPEGFTAFQNPDGTWTRISCIDNASKIDEGFYQFVKVQRYSLKIETLKNIPKELNKVKQ